MSFLSDLGSTNNKTAVKSSSANLSALEALGVQNQPTQQKDTAAGQNFPNSGLLTFPMAMLPNKTSTPSSTFDVVKEASQPSALDVVKQLPAGLSEASTQIFRGAIRGEQAVARSALEALGVKVPQYSTEGASRLEKAVGEQFIGNEPVPTISEYGKEILPKFAQKGPLPFVTGLGLTALDFTGWGGEKSAIKALTTAKDEGQVLKILKDVNVADDLAREYAPILAKTSTEAEVSKIITHIDDLQKTTSETNKGVEAISTIPTQNSKTGFLSADRQIPEGATVLTQEEQKARDQLARSNLSREIANTEKPPQLSSLDKPSLQNTDGNEFSPTWSYADSVAQTPTTRQEARDAFTAYDLHAGAAESIDNPQMFPSLTSGAMNFNDISGFKAQARDLYRNFEHFFGDRFQEAKRLILDPFDAAKARYVAEQKSILKDLKSTVVDGLGIAKGSKESAAVQQYGEGKRTFESLVEEFGKPKADNIVEADKWFRKTYDRLLDEVNATRRQIYPKNESKIIPYRQDYYRHFQEMSNGFEGLKGIFETPAGISPELSGISPFTKPKSKFASFMQPRFGVQTTEDAVGGFLKYLPSAMYAKNIDPQIPIFRNLAKDFATATEKTKNVNNFIEYLQDFANDLAGKTNAADRFIQKVIPGGRKAFRLIEFLNNRVKANVIVGNLSSAVAQIFNVPQGIASAKQFSVPGAIRTLGSIFADDKAISKSAFIKERYLHSSFNQFDVKILDKAKNFAAWMTGVLDEVGTKFIWNSHYEKALAEGVEDPIKYADDITRKLVAGRGVGEVPLIQKSKIFQLVAPFQLEVGNLWYVMGDMVKKKDFGGLATLFVANWLMNRVAEQVRGSDVTFDPINAVYEGIQEIKNEDNPLKGIAKAGGRVAGEVVSNVPLGQTLGSLYPEYGFDIPGIGKLTRKELMGEGDPTRYGTGLSIVRGLQDPIFKVLPGFGGAQLERSIQGVKAYDAGKVTNAKGDTKFEIDQNVANFLRTLLFGPNSTPEARAYFSGQSADKSGLPGLPELPSLPPLPELPPLPALPSLP